MQKVLNAAHRQRLEKTRKLSACLLEELGVYSLREEAASPICFDYIVNGQVWNTKIRYGKGEMPWEQRDKPLRFWNEDAAASATDLRRLIITEGEFDAAACIQADFPVTVSVPNGARLQPAGGEDQKAFAYLYRHSTTLWPWLERFERIILATDGDGPGRTLRDDLAIRLGDTRCSWISWPEGCKDPNDVLIRHDENTLRNCILDARPMWNDEVCTPNEHFHDSEDMDGLTTGIPDLDDHVRLKLPEFFVIAGPPSSGKSIFLRQFLYSLWKTHGWRFLLTVFEEPDCRYRREFRRHILGMRPGEWSDEDRVRADFEYGRCAVLYRRPRGVALSPIRLFDRIEYAVKVYGVRVVAIDPINEIDHDYGRMTVDQYWSKFIIACKNLADDYGILFVVCGHVPAEILRNMHPRRPVTIADMAGGAHWFNKSDHAITLWRPWDDEVGVMRVCKTKDNETMGRPTTIELVHDPVRNAFKIGRRGKRMLDILVDEWEERNGCKSRPKKKSGWGLA